MKRINRWKERGHGYVDQGQANKEKFRHDEDSRLFTVIMWVLVVVFALLFMFREGHTAQEEETSFEIKGYIVRGNTLLNYDRIMEGLKFYSGQNKTSKDV